MGLDMYAYKTKGQIGEVDFDLPDDSVKIAYWRQHPNLHGWMERLYVLKGGEQCFNCATVKLDACDIEMLANAVKKRTLPETEGFLFGESRPEHESDDEEFIAAARLALQDGYSIAFYSWW